MADRLSILRPVAIAFFLLLITGAVFHDVLSAGFVRWDDGLHVYGNPYLHPASAAHLIGLWSGPYRYLYVPVSYTLYWLLAHAAQLPAPVQAADGNWVDMNPRVFHGANLLLHAANVVLVFVLLRRLLPGKALTSRAGQTSLLRANARASPAMKGRVQTGVTIAVVTGCAEWVTRNSPRHSRPQGARLVSTVFSGRLSTRQPISPAISGTVMAEGFASSASANVPVPSAYQSFPRIASPDRT